ncbi:DUF4440 domain-containing protein [Ruegeria sediminis]|uniref:DUF4440 domain-containing protein n=1 Tax=Ruegeria sediminis TaxID=2583820 RepID=A0ABY2WUQ9_9RHOB|nr:DUF4440 domain-containing protein [Ruegeria sediminis]TMV06341.1 DUF4440 domain-containing protein [Ruegeria sediminis]
MAIEDELQKLLDDYVTAYRVSDAAACALVFTTDARIISPYGPAAFGRAEIERIHREWMQDGAEDKRVEVVEAGQSGDLAWCLARFSEGESEGEGTSLNVFERQKDGRWQIRMCSMNEA